MGFSFLNAEVAEHWSADADVAGYLHHLLSVRMSVPEPHC